MKRIRILLVGLPALLSDIVGEAFAREADMEIMSLDAPRTTASALARTMGPDVIVTSADPSDANSLAAEIQKVGGSIVLLAVAPKGDRALLFSAGRSPLEISDISTNTLLATIRDHCAVNDSTKLPPT